MADRIDTRDPPSAQPRPTLGQRVRTILGELSNVLQGVLAVGTVVAFVTHVAPQRLIGFGLYGIAGLAMLGALAPWRPRWVHEASRIVLALTVAIMGFVVVLHNPPPSTVNIVAPASGAVVPTCSVEVRFIGEPPRGQTFAVATVQGTSAHYFEGGVWRDPTSGEWHARVQVGSSNKGLGEQFDIQVYALDKNLAAYLTTMRQDQDRRNTWWTSTALPPGVDEPAGAISVSRATDEDPTCRQ
jgi:hypothetical protein